MPLRTLLALSLVLFFVGFANAANPPLWKAESDTVFLQEVGRKIPSDQPVTALAVQEGTVYAVIEGRLHRMQKDALYTLNAGRAEQLRTQGFDAVAEVSGTVRHLETLDGALWVAAEDGVYRHAEGAWEKLSDLQMVDFCLHRGAVHGATRDRIYRLVDTGFVDIEPEGGWLTTDTTNIMEDGTQVLPNPVRLGPIQQIASYHETLYILRPRELALLEGALFNEYSLDWGAFPSDNIHQMMTHGSRVYFSTDQGLSELRGMALTTIRGEDGLPDEDTTCLARGFDGDVWIGTKTGAVRRTRDNDWHYFGAHHWLPSDGVNAIAVDDTHKVVYIATDAGLGVIRYEPYTLRKKADHFEKQLSARGHLRMGFVHKLWWSDQYDQWIREISDNDGGHTAHYLAAMCFKYAVTGDRKDYEAAVDAFTAMVWLEQITPKRGFFARAIWTDEGDLGERSKGGSGGLPAKWYETDDGKWWWKGDTSSDEVNAHYYAVSLFHDLVAKGDTKTRAKQHLTRITDHIIENGWILRDMDGGPTRWGRWNPEYLLRPYGIEARGLNGMEAQGYVWTAYGLSGDKKYMDALDQLIDWGYHRYTVREKHAFPPESIVTWDDELAFRTFHPMLRYAEDPELRGIYMRALVRHWEILRMQKLPYFNFVYGALTGNDCEVDEAVKHLRAWNLDTVNHNFRNIHRDDLRKPEPGYVPYGGGTRGLSPRESTSMWGSRSAIHYNGGSGGRGITPAVGWIEDYWMGRYYGFITEPETNDDDLLEASLDPQDRVGAAPYDGPARPDGILELVD
jgi:hypothetical protein